MDNAELLQKAQEIARKHKLDAMIEPNVHSVGVQGDGRVYLPVITLTGTFVSWDAIRQASDEITNALPVSRVGYDTAGLPGREQKKKV